jgi:antitoxin CcdA
MNAPLKRPRRSTNVSLAADLVEEAKALDINLSRACEAGLEAALREERKRRWQEENRAAMEVWGTWHEEHGLPLERYRLF